MTEFSVRSKGKIWKFIKNRRFYHKIRKSIRPNLSRKMLVFLIGVFLVVVGFLILYFGSGTIFNYDTGTLFDFPRMFQKEDPVRDKLNNNPAGNGEKRVVSIEDYLLESDLVRDLPEKAVVELYIDNGVFYLGKNRVERNKFGSPDITINTGSFYFKEYADQGLCGVLGKAWNNEDMGIKLHESKMALSWKYKGVMKYRSCLGL